MRFSSAPASFIEMMSCLSISADHAISVVVNVCLDIDGSPTAAIVVARREAPAPVII